jgi:hypothetical protein
LQLILNCTLPLVATDSQLQPARGCGLNMVTGSAKKSRNSASFFSVYFASIDAVFLLYLFCRRDPAVTLLLSSMSLSSQLRSSLESIRESLEICEKILNPVDKDQEEAEQLEDWSRWVD